MTIIAQHSRRSFWNYLTLSDAVAMVGRVCVEGWRKNDSIDATADDASAQRYGEAVQRLKHWLIGAEVSAWTTDDEGAWVKIKRTRTSKPYFDIDVTRSAFKWGPDNWATMMIDRRSLDARLAAITKAKPRKNSFRWQDISAIAWKVALETPHPRARQPLLVSVQLRCAAELDFEPGEKELGPVVDDIIRHLDGYELSKVV